MAYDSFAATARVQASVGELQLRRAQQAELLQQCRIREGWVSQQLKCGPQDLTRLTEAGVLLNYIRRRRRQSIYMVPFSCIHSLSF